MLVKESIQFGYPAQIPFSLLNHFNELGTYLELRLLWIAIVLRGGIKHIKKSFSILTYFQDGS